MHRFMKSPNAYVTLFLITLLFRVAIALPWSVPLCY